MVSYSRRPQSGHFTCYLNRTYHVLLTQAKGALAQKDVTSYSVACAPPSERDTTAVRVRVRFGQQGVLTVKGRVNGIVLYEVSELIGMFTEWPTGKIE